jgi:hypothetical protein
MRQSWIDRLCTLILMILIVVLVSGFIAAQTQDYINATMAEQLHGLNFRVEKIESMLNYILTAVVGSLIVQLMQVRLQARAGKKDS